MNRGGGRFRAAASTTDRRRPAAIAIGDLNGDRKLDLVTGERGEHGLRARSTEAAARFRAKRDYRTGPGPRAIAIGDLNADGKPDLATANLNVDTGPPTVSVLLNRGEGTFRARRDYEQGMDLFRSRSAT